MDAGKSTLMGHLLYLLGNVNKRTMHKYEQESKKAGKASFAYAWVLDETGEERDRYNQKNVHKYLSSPSFPTTLTKVSCVAEMLSKFLLSALAMYIKQSELHI